MSWILIILPATLQQNKSCASAQTSLMPSVLSHRRVRQLFHYESEIQSSHRIFFQFRQRSAAPSLSHPQPQVSCRNHSSQGLSLLLQWQVGFQKMKAQGKVVERTLVFIDQGKFVCNKGTQALDRGGRTIFFRGQD